MKIKKEALVNTMKCVDSVSSYTKSPNIHDQDSNNPHFISNDINVTVSASESKVTPNVVCAIKPQNASIDSWRSDGILRQALLSSISSSGQMEKSELGLNASSVLPKIQDDILSTVDDVKLSGDLPPVSVHNHALSHESFSPSEFSSPMTSLPSVTSPFPSLPFGPLSSNSLSGGCSVTVQESLPIINQMHVVNQTSLQSKSSDILTTTHTDSVSSHHNSSVSATNVENVTASLVSAVTSYPGVSPNLMCQALASLASKDNSVTVVYSSIPKAEPLSTELIHNIQKTVPLPSMSEVKSSLSHHLNIMPHTHNKLLDNHHNKVSLTLSGISSNTDQALSFESLPSSEVEGTLSAIKLDDQNNSSDFNGDSSEAVKFNSNQASDLTSSIVIPVSSDVILTKIDGQSSGSHQDISHIITIPLPPNAIYNSSLSIPMPLSLTNSAPSGTSVQMTPAIVSNLPYSIAGISNQCWQSPAVALSVTCASSSHLSTSVTTSLPVSIMSVAPSMSSIPNNNIVHFSSNSVSLPSQVVSPSVRTVPQDPVCYSAQSTAEILSQLSKAGVLPTMSSNQVSSVLSALGLDSHVDLEADNANHSEILTSQVLSGDKVSTVTQTDSVEMSVLQQYEKVIQLLSGQQLVEHSLNGSQMMMPASNQLQTVGATSSLNSAELVTDNVETKQISSFPRIVAMVLNSPSVNSDKTVSNTNHVNGFKNSENRESNNKESCSEVSTDNPCNNLHNFLVLPSNSKSPCKRPKRTSALRKMLLGPEDTSLEREKDSKKTRRRTIKVKEDSSFISDCNEGKNDKIVGNVNVLYQGIVDHSSFSKEAGCYKCKSCPFLSIEESSMVLHVKETHCSRVEELSIVRQKLKCPGCANVFFTTNSLEVHLKQDHRVNTPELKAITSSAIKVAAEGNIQMSEVKKKKKRIVRKCDTKANNNVNGTSILLSCGDIPVTAGPSNSSQSTLDTSGALIFSTNNNSEADILTNNKKICVKDLSSGNSMNTTNKIGFSFISVSDSNLKDSECVMSQEKNKDDPVVGSLEVLNEQKSSDPSGKKDENSNSNKTEEKGTVLTQKRKRGRPRGSKSSTLTAGIMGATDKDNGQSPKKTNLGHRCNVDNCAVTMRSPENIEYHRSCHVGADFQCPECSYKHCHWNGMSTHLWRIHMVDMELYTCDQCNYKTVSYAKLVNLHKWIHGSERPFLCDTCGKGFKNRKQLRNHERIHQPEQTKIDECEICGRSFTNSRMLRMHLDNVHNKLRPHLCNYCGYSASSVSSLKLHMRKHTGEKPFQCNLCDYCTADHNSLRRHKMRHTGDKPYKCPHCSYACIQSSTYKAHLKTKHPGMDDGLMFSCNICSFRSVKEENYIAHLAEHKRDVKYVPQKVDQEEQDIIQEKFDLDQQSDTVIQLVEHLENGSSEHFSLGKLGGLDSGCDVQMALDSDFETEEITGDISEAELITGDLGEPQDFKLCENELKIKSHHEDLHTANL